MARAKKRKTKSRARSAAKPRPKPKKRVAPSAAKEKLRRQLAAAKGAATRKANARAKLEADRAAFFKRNRDKAKRLAKKRRKEKARARQLATRARKGGKSILATLEGAYETMREHAPFVMALHVKLAPRTNKGDQPWLIGGFFTPEEAVGWLDIGEWCETLENDLILEATINPQRTTFMRFVFQMHDDETDEPVGEPEGYSAGGAGSWERVISEAHADLANVIDLELRPESLAAKYPMARVLEIQILFSANIA